jgi:hypothetical protein
MSPEQKEFLKSQVESLKKSQSKIARKSPMGYYSFLGELLHIFRPIIYGNFLNSTEFSVLSMFKYGEKSWRPLVYSFLVEIASLIPYLRNEKPNGEEEKKEIGRRMLLLRYYLIRSPMFEYLRTKSPKKAQDLVQTILRVPLLGNIVDSLWEYVKMYQVDYFFTAGS